MRKSDIMTERTTDTRSRIPVGGKSVGGFAGKVDLDF